MISYCQKHERFGVRSTRKAAAHSGSRQKYVRSFRFRDSCLSPLLARDTATSGFAATSASGNRRQARLPRSRLASWHSLRSRGMHTTRMDHGAVFASSTVHDIIRCILRSRHTGNFEQADPSTTRPTRPCATRETPWETFAPGNFRIRCRSLCLYRRPQRALRP